MSASRKTSDHALGERMSAIQALHAFNHPSLPPRGQLQMLLLREAHIPDLASVKGAPKQITLTHPGCSLAQNAFTDAIESTLHRFVLSLQPGDRSKVAGEIAECELNQPGLLPDRTRPLAPWSNEEWHQLTGRQVELVAVEARRGHAGGRARTRARRRGCGSATVRWRLMAEGEASKRGGRN